MRHAVNAASVSSGEGDDVAAGEARARMIRSDVALDGGRCRRRSEGDLSGGSGRRTRRARNRLGAEARGTRGRSASRGYSVAEGSMLPMDYAGVQGESRRDQGGGQVELAAAAVKIGQSELQGPPQVELGRALLLLGDAPGALAALRKGVDAASPTRRSRTRRSAIALARDGRQGTSALTRDAARRARSTRGARRGTGTSGTVLFMRGRVSEAVREYRAAGGAGGSAIRGRTEISGRRCSRKNDIVGALPELNQARSRSIRSRATFRSNLRIRAAATGEDRRGDRRSTARRSEARSGAGERVDQPGDGAGERSEAARRSAASAGGGAEDRPDRSAREGERRRARRAGEVRRTLTAQVSSVTDDTIGLRRSALPPVRTVLPPARTPPTSPSARRSRRSRRG